jgi:hypothetical protein
VENGDRQASRVRIAYFGSLPPRQGSVAAYGERLLKELARRAEVGVFVEGESPSRAIAECCQVHDLAQVHYRNVLFGYDVVVYSVPGEPRDGSWRAALGEWPGIVVLHDADLEGLLAREPDLRRPILETAAALVVHSAPLAEQLRRRWAAMPVFLLESREDRVDRLADAFLGVCRDVLERGARWLEPLLETACAEIPGFAPGDRLAPWRAEVDELARLGADGGAPLDSRNLRHREVG